MARTYFAKNICVSSFYVDHTKRGRFSQWVVDPLLFLGLRKDAIGGDLEAIPDPNGCIHITFKNHSDYTMFVLKFGAKYS